MIFGDSVARFSALFGKSLDVEELFQSFVLFQEREKQKTGNLKESMAMEWTRCECIFKRWVKKSGMKEKEKTKDEPCEFDLRGMFIFRLRGKSVFIDFSTYQILSTGCTVSMITTLEVATWWLSFGSTGFASGRWAFGPRSAWMTSFSEKKETKTLISSIRWQRESSQVESKRSNRTIEHTFFFLSRWGTFLDDQGGSMDERIDGKENIFFHLTWRIQRTNSNAAIAAITDNNATRT